MTAHAVPSDWPRADAIGFLQAQWPWLAQDEIVMATPLRIDAVADEDCMLRWQDGDERSFRVLYLRYRDKLYRYTLRLAAHPQEAEEVFQEVWLAVVRGKHGYAPGASFASWLFSIAHRRAADRWRALGRHAPDGVHAASVDEVQSAHESAPAAGLSPEGHAHNDALGQALQRAVRALPLPQREAFLMKAEGGLSLEDIALATGVPRETVKSRLRYAQQRLREALEPWL
jgi:RNA polymerase sigma-70 factor (ECF subfamily)